MRRKRFKVGDVVRLNSAGLEVDPASSNMQLVVTKAESNRGVFYSTPLGDQVLPSIYDASVSWDAKFFRLDEFMMAAMKVKNRAGGVKDV